MKNIIKKTLISFGIIFLFSTGCKNPKTNETNIFFDSVRVDFEDVTDFTDSLVPVSHTDNTYKVKKNSIIFFKLNKDEKKELFLQHGEHSKYEFISLFNDFENYVSSAKRRAKKKGINAELTTDYIFEIEMDSVDDIIYNRKKDEQIMGVIFSDGKQQPVKEYGILNYKEFNQLFENFFGKTLDTDDEGDSTSVIK